MMERVKVQGLIGIAILAASCVLGLTVAYAAERGSDLAVVYDTPRDGMTVKPQADGPLYDAPYDVEQAIVRDRENREYILLRTEQGGIAIIPYLDGDGAQRVTPRP